MTLPNCLFACSVVVIPDGETRKIETFSVFCVTMIFSVFAYVWLLIILVVNSPDRVEVWEAAVTLAFIPVVVFASWCVVSAKILKKLRLKNMGKSRKKN